MAELTLSPLNKTLHSGPIDTSYREKSGPSELASRLFVSYCIFNSITVPPRRVSLRRQLSRAAHGNWAENTGGDLNSEISISFTSGSWKLLKSRAAQLPSQ